MPEPKGLELTIDKVRYYVLFPYLPFIDVCLQSTAIRPSEFEKIVKLAENYPNDPRLIEMVRKGGDASAKVPYLMEAGETPDSILATLREIARPYIERIESLPDPIRATIHLLLSLNTVPEGCEKYGITALLEIDRIQAEFIRILHDRMKSRHLAGEFVSSNVAALQQLDLDWPRLREEKNFLWHKKLLPEKARMQVLPLYDGAGRLITVYETCVIVDSPKSHTLQKLIPPVLRRPLPVDMPVPQTGSADWLIREVGKVGRHLTRGLLDIIKTHLAEEQIALEIRNVELINQRAHEALKEHIETTP